MRRTFLILVIAAAAAIGPAGRPALAADEVEVYFGDTLEPAATMAHPGTKEVAVVVTESLDLVACDFWYYHSRYGEVWPEDFPALEGGGELKVSMKRVSGRRKKKVGSQTEAVTLWHSSSRVAVVGFADSPVVCEWCVAEHDFTFKTSKRFPLRVEPGDLLLWQVTFTGMPDLEVDRERDPWYADQIWFHGKCSTCGTIDHPCSLPLPLWNWR